MLHRGNLTARERYILLIQNDVERMKTGKDVLTSADKDALENWKARNNDEAREWNRLNDAWKQTGKMELEAELIYKDAQVAYLSQLPIVMKLLYYPAIREMRGCLETLKHLKKVTVEEASEIAAKQRAVKMKEGIDFEYAVYQLAFERLSPEDQKCMNDLYADIETDHQYLDQEEIIANLYGGTTELSQSAKEKLADLIAEQSYNKFAKEYQLFHYFACIPLVEIAKHYLKKHGVMVQGKKSSKNQEADDEDVVTCDEVTKAMNVYASEHGTTIRDMLKEGFMSAYDDGILEEYRPLASSNMKEVLDTWIATKIEARKILMKHIESGELMVRERTPQESRKEMLYSKGLYDGELDAARKVLEYLNIEIHGKDEFDEKHSFERFDGGVITGDSIYGLKADYEFVKKFRERVHTYDPNLGIVYADNDPEQKDEHLDQEFIICGLNGKGEANFFSLYGMAMSKLSILADGDSFFKDERCDGRTYLEFKHDGIEAAFRAKRQDLIDGYAKLLAFRDLLKKLERIYETDMTYHVEDRLKTLKNYIEENNQAIRVATNTNGKDEKPEFGLIFKRSTLHIKDDLIIDIDAIRPDEKVVEQHLLKLEQILGHF